jgi:hypothetical protein
MTSSTGIALRTGLWLLLGGWVGSFGLFGLVIAPTAFTVLPSTEIAGTLVAPVLTSIHLYALVAGLGLAALAAALGRGRLRIGLPLVLAAACAYSQFGVSAEIAEIRDGAFGPEGSIQSAARWNALHEVSMGLFIGVSIGILVLLGLHAASDAQEAEQGSPKR